MSSQVTQKGLLQHPGRVDDLGLWSRFRDFFQRRHYLKAIDFIIIIVSDGATICK
jgi:hypothetical protein